MEKIALAASEAASPSSQNADPAMNPTATVGVQSQGVTRMEAMYRSTKGDRRLLWLAGISVSVCAWVYSLDFATSHNYSVDVSSYYRQHSTVLATLGIVTNIISAVSKPFIAKFSDITSRPYTYIFGLVFYVMGYVIVSTSSSISAYVVGEAFVSLGSSGIDLVNDIIVADLTPLEWRGFLGGLLSTPFVINTWFAGKIVQAILSKGQWRWGYGMFAIIMPVAITPAIATLIYLDRKAKKSGTVSLASGGEAQHAEKQVSDQIGHDGVPTINSMTVTSSRGSWLQKFKRGMIEIDSFGLLLLGFGWALLLLPFSLKTYAQHGWKNQSLIAMFVVGGVLWIAYVVYEIKWAPMPSAPRRLVFNKTLITCIIIESFYFISGNMRGLYWSSYVYVVKPWSYQNWVYYNSPV